VSTPLLNACLLLSLLAPFSKNLIKRMVAKKFCDIVDDLLVFYGEG
jgi:hypothetical protein